MRIIRTIALLILVLIVASGHVRVSADQIDSRDESYNTQLSEYDYYVSVRAMTLDEAERVLKIDSKDFYEIKNIEKKIVELSQMTDVDLYNRGMDIDRIAVLREYDGSRIEDNPQLKTVLATLSVTLSKVSSSSTAVKAKANWSWNSKPIVTSIDFYETAAFRWKAYNSSNAQITATYTGSGSYCNVTYYNGNNAQTTQQKYINVGNYNSYVYSQFYSEVVYGGSQCWGKTGEMVVKITGSNISKVNFGFGYNHGVSSTAPTVSLDAYLGFNYSNGYEMAEQSISINV